MLGHGPIGSAPLSDIPDWPDFPEIQNAVNSADWTGIEARLAVDPALTQQIVEIVRQLDIELDKAGLTNQEKAEAKALTSAISALVNSPTPAWKVVAHAFIALFNNPAVSAAFNAAALGTLIYNGLKALVAL